MHRADPHSSPSLAGVSPTAPPTAAPPTSTWREVADGLWAAVRRHARRTALAALLLILAKLAAVAVPLIFKAIIDRFNGAPSTGVDVSGTHMALVLPVFLLLGYAIVRFCGTLFTELRDLVFARVVQHTSTFYAEAAFARLMALSPRYHSRRSTGALLREIERGTAGVGFLIGTALFTVLPTLLEFAAVVAIMAAGYSLWFTLLIFVTFVAYAAYTTVMTQQRSVRQRRVNQMDEKANARLVDSLINYETVKAFAREGYEQQRYAQLCAAWIEQRVKNQRALSLLHVGQSAIIAFGVAGVMLLAGEHTVRGTMTVGDLVLVNSYIIQVCLPLNALGFVFREARDALVNAEALFALLAVSPDVADAPTSTPLQVTGGEVRFEKVNFSYEPGRQVLFDVDFRIGPGQKVAVVGGSGSGKSTLARLLLRFYDVEQGRVLIDGQDLRSVQLASLREAIGLVPQDTVLFNDTIAFNIRYGHLQAGMDQVISAAKAAQLHDLVQSLPLQYETIVGERGTKLSGGEKQRLAIARAFLRNPPIMVLDEATSALDTRSERAIQGELDRVAAGRTTLVVAHRLSTVVDADQIIVLDKGRIVERGTHTELLAAEGLYAQLWQLQRQQREVERLERQLARQPVDLVALAASAIEGLREDIESRGIAVYTDLEVERLHITGDASTLAEAVQRLCWQAMQATPVGGRMALRLQRDQSVARMEIIDGRHAPPGVSPPLADAPGAPYGSDEPLDPLALRSLIERHGGQFRVESPTTTQGLRFIIELPLRQASARASSAAEPLPTADLQGVRVLAVGAPETADEWRAPLIAAGATLQTMTHGEEAIHWFGSHPSSQWPQLLLCELQDAGDGGRDLMRRLRRLETERALPLERRTPAIAVVSNAEPDTALRAVMAGFQAYVARPFKPHALLQTALGVLHRRSSH